MNRGLAIYIHVPFCRQRCAYCHFDIKIFHPRTDPAPFQRRYREAVCEELRTRSRECRERSVGSVFFGGGTPSRLPLPDLDAILDTIRGQFTIEADAEITLEANPEDVDGAYLRSLREMGFTRLSLGVQTFDDTCLNAINRAHDSARARRVLGERPDFPDGTSIDLMLGLPGQTRDTLARDLDTLAMYALDHVSLYMLETDLPTPLDKQRDRLPDEDSQADDYETATDRLEEMGLQPYEISNFSRTGKQSRHNLVYWRCGDYLGIGPAACGRIGKRFRRNFAALTPYCSSVRRTGHGTEEDTLWNDERLRQERIIQGLRLVAGVPQDWIRDRERRRLQPHLNAGLCRFEGARLALTRAGRLLANEIFEIFLP